MTVCGDARALDPTPINDVGGNVMNQDAKVGLIVPGFIALGVCSLWKVPGPPSQLDPRFILIVIVIGGNLVCR